MRESWKRAEQRQRTGSVRKDCTRCRSPAEGLELGRKASIWTERMVAALENGVKGGKWFSLIDKVCRPETLWSAWRKVAKNEGAAGVDGQSVAQFGAQAETYLQELEGELRAGTYRPQPVRRVKSDPALAGTWTIRSDGRMPSSLAWTFSP